MNDSPQISPEFKTLDRDVVAGLPKVTLHSHVDLVGSDGGGNVEDQVRAHVQRLAEENVIYAELRINPEAVTGVDAGEVIDQAVSGATAVEGIDARIVVTAMRHLDSGQKLAEVTVDKRGETVVGFDVAGEGPLTAAHADVVDYLRANFVPVTLRAGGEADVEAAVRMHPQRLAHAVDLVDDFSASLDGIEAGPVSDWVRDRGMCLEFTPTLETSMGLVEDYTDHPLTLLQQMGFTVTAQPGNPSMNTVTDELFALVETFDYGLDELFDLTRVAIENAFAGVETRQELVMQLLRAYEDTMDDGADSHEHDHHDHD